MSGDNVVGGTIVLSQGTLSAGKRSFVKGSLPWSNIGQGFCCGISVRRCGAPRAEHPPWGAEVAAPASCRMLTSTAYALKTNPYFSLGFIQYLKRPEDETFDKFGSEVVFTAPRLDKVIDVGAVLDFQNVVGNSLRAMAATIWARRAGSRPKARSPSPG